MPQPPPEPTRKEKREQARAARKEQERLDAQGAARRKRLLTFGAGGLAAAAVIVLVIVLLSSGGSSSPTNSTNANSPANAPGSQLAGTTQTIAGQTIGGIQCNQSEQVAFHIHSHLAIYVSGQPRIIPAGIGIPSPQTTDTAQGPFVASGSCFYWLHVHTNDGIIHIESPIQRSFTLGDFFAVWGQPLGPNRVGPAVGKVTSYLNGKRYNGNPASIPVGYHQVIQLDVGSPAPPPQPYQFAQGL